MKKGGKARGPTSSSEAAGAAAEVLQLPVRRRREPAEVAPGVFLGSQRSSDNVAYLRSLNITHVLSIGVDTLHPSEFNHKRIKGLQDSPTADLLSRLEECIGFMEEAIRANSCVLVHCKGGICRSSAVVVAYIMHSNRIPADEALARLRDIRPTSHPRAEFMDQLRIFERSLLAQASEAEVGANREQDAASVQKTKSSSGRTSRAQRGRRK